MSGSSSSDLIVAMRAEVSLKSLSNQMIQLNIRSRVGPEDSPDPGLDFTASGVLSGLLSAAELVGEGGGRR